MEFLEKRIETFLINYPIITLKEMLIHELSDPTCQDPIWNILQNKEGKSPFPKNFIHILLYVRNLHKNLFHIIEDKEACKQKTWQAQEQHPDKSLFGGGVMNVIRESILEKAAVNMSVVHGPKYPSMEGDYAGKPFAAGGVSLISHPKNPQAPIMHMNIRCVQVGDKENMKTWIGGGADLTPMIIFDEDVEHFHNAMEQSCTKNPSLGNYEKFKKWADEYFFIPHRKESRGVGGIFFDFLFIENEEDFSFLLDVGQYAAHAYAKIMSRRILLPYDNDLLEKHLYWRGRYAEFNLVYDRGTRFGLLTGGNSEAILCSLPPTVRW